MIFFFLNLTHLIFHGILVFTNMHQRCTVQLKQTFVQSGTCIKYSMESPFRQHYRKCEFIHNSLFSRSTRPSLSHSTDTDSVNQGPRPDLLPKFAISAESEGDETSGLGDPSKTSFSIGELLQDENDATTPGSTHSGATLSGSVQQNKTCFGLLLFSEISEMLNDNNIHKTHFMVI